MSEQNHIIEVHNLTVQFNSTTVLENLSVNIKANEIFAIVGGSGTGKTTLLRAILMLIPAQGSIRIFGKEILNGAPEDRSYVRHHWGVMFQQGALFSSLTLIENVAYPLQEHTNLKDNAIYEIAKLKLAIVGLDTPSFQRYPDEISGGMRKRVALARAIALDPDIVFLDEPTAGLDPQSASALDELVLNLKESLGLTIVMVTHDLDTLWTTTDRVAFLGNKKVLQVDTMEHLQRSKITPIQDYFNVARAKVARNIYE